MQVQRPAGVTTEDIKAALLEARAKIESEECEFICVALPDTPAGNYVQEYIESSIQEQCNRSTLSNFVYCMTKDSRAYNREFIREYRLRYIDWMLDQ